jgi:hypothetical protein
MNIDSPHFSLKGRLTHSLFNDAVSSSGYVASNDAMIGE